MGKNWDVIVIGSGMGSLSAAALMASKGLKIKIIEQNWIPGGCSSSYPRKNYIFESGATTLVGLDKGMPLSYLLQQTGIEVNAHLLELPMQVHLPNGEILTRFNDLNQWIAEAERVFGPKGQRAFWEYCFKISQFVWETSIRQRRFPPKTFGDLWFTLKNSKPAQFKFATLAYRSVEDLLKKHGLENHTQFRQFVDEQLMITAQNKASEVNVLFGSTALCYTNFGNYYVFGGMMNLIQPIVKFIEKKGGEINYREQVQSITSLPEGGYAVETDKGIHHAKYVLSGIPLNDTLPLFKGEPKQKLKKKELSSKQLRGAVTFGFVFKRHRNPGVLHHQIILKNPLPGIASDSIFVSLSHPDDHLRCPEDMTVANVSTHVHDPENTFVDDEAKALLEQAVIAEMARLNILKPENIVFQHTSTPGSWFKWTKRYKGFVGGYPQYMDIKPWQMVESRLDRSGAYLCGDSAYPGQGIPGATLSGIIAFEKLKADFL